MSAIAGVKTAFYEGVVPSDQDVVLSLVITSPLSGDWEMDLSHHGVAMWQVYWYLSGGLVQNVFPMLSVTERESIIRGFTAEEQKRAFG